MATLDQRGGPAGACGARWIDQSTFDEPLVDLRQDSRSAWFREEIAREVTAGHPLFQRSITVVAKVLPQDDVLVVADDVDVFMVHLTWSQHAEQPPWPRTYAVPTHEALTAFIDSTY